MTKNTEAAVQKTRKALDRAAKAQAHVNRLLEPRPVRVEAKGLVALPTTTQTGIETTTYVVAANVLRVVASIRPGKSAVIQTDGPVSVDADAESVAVAIGLALTREW